MIYESGRQPKLFNLDRDPSEQNDVALQRSEQTAWYRQVLLDWLP
jgi:hypothetical protein